MKIFSIVALILILVASCGVTPEERKKRPLRDAPNTESNDVLEQTTKPDSAKTEDTASIQLASIADRTITTTEFAPFRQSAQLRNISPALNQAQSQDVVINQPGFSENDSFTTVILKPRITGKGTLEIPPPASDANVRKHLEDYFTIAAQDDTIGTIKFPRNMTLSLVPAVLPQNGQPGGRHLKISNLTDKVIDLNGSTLQLTQVSLGLLFEDCNRLVIKNGKIAGRQLLATIAKVVKDDSNAGYKFELLPEYRELYEAPDAGTHQLITIGTVEKSPSGDWIHKVENYRELFVNRAGTDKDTFAYSNGVFTAVKPLSDPKRFTPGEDYVFLQHQKNLGMGTLIDNETPSSDITFEDLSFVNIPGMAITGEVVRGIHINRVRFEKAPGSVDRFLAVGADGIHINNNGGDILIENSYLDSTPDDKITINGNYWRVSQLDKDTKTLTIEPAGRSASSKRWGWTGDRIIFIDGNFGVIGESQLAQNSKMMGSSKKHQIFLTEVPISIKEGDLVADVDTSGGRIIIRNNKFIETRAQAVLVQSSHVAVQNNFFEGMMGQPIKINMGLHFWYEGVNAYNILVADNCFGNNAKSAAKTHELVYINQVNESEQQVKVMDKIKISGNRLRATASEYLQECDPS